MKNLAKIAKDNIRRWRADPVCFVREVFLVEPDEWQIDFLRAYAEGNRIAAKACKGPGKTAVLAWCAWHYLVTRLHPKIIATSISGDNLKDGLWSEMSKWQQKSRFLTETFVWQKETIFAKHHPQTWFMAARQWSRTADKDQQGNTLAGKHADNMMFILDEAGGIPDAVMASAEAALANAGSELNPNAEAKLLICGNPTHLSGPLYRACTKEASLWKVIEITGDPDDPKRSKRISIQWAREQIHKYGRDNAWVLVNVFGKFPPSSLNALIGPDEMRAAMKRVVKPEVYNWAAKIIGGDIARQGDDTSTICPRQGIVCFKPKIMRIPDTVGVASNFAASITKWKPDGVNIDCTGGYGAGVVDVLRNWGHTVNEVYFSGKAMDAQFYNKRSEMIWKFVQWIKGGGVLPNLPALLEEATAMTYYFHKDKIRIVEKDQIKEIIGRSPDLFDGYACTFAFDIARRDAAADYRIAKNDDANPLDNFMVENYRSKQSVDDWNPLS
jgi:hypothetical protein